MQILQKGARLVSSTQWNSEFHWMCVCVFLDACLHLVVTSATWRVTKTTGYTGLRARTMAVFWPHGARTVSEQRIVCAEYELPPAMTGCRFSVSWSFQAVGQLLVHRLLRSQPVLWLKHSTHGSGAHLFPFPLPVFEVRSSLGVLHTHTDTHTLSTENVHVHTLYDVCVCVSGWALPDADPETTADANQQWLLPY